MAKDFRTDVEFSNNALIVGNLTASTGISRFGNVGIGTTNPVAQLHVLSTNAASVGIIVQGASSQSADLQEWRNINGSAVAEISASITPLILTNVQNASNIQQWRNSSGSVLARITASGGAEFTSASVGGALVATQQYVSTASVAYATESGNISDALASINLYLSYNFV